MAVHFEISTNVSHVFHNFNGILLDAYGVFWGGNEYGVLPGSKELMEHLVTHGKIVGVLSNSTQLASKEVSKLERYGIIQGTHFHFLITSGEVTRYIFLNEKLPFETLRNTYWLFGGMHPKFSSHTAIFDGTVYQETLDINEADFIYISVPHIHGEDQTDPELFRHEIERIKSKNLPMVCSNPDLFAHEGSPPKAVVRQGSIAKMYEEMGGRVLYIGKPYSKVYSRALEQFHERGIILPNEIIMVGDTPETDIRGANQCGMSSLLLTETGIMADRISQKGLEKALKELASQDTPNYLITRFSYGIHSSPKF